MTTIIFDSTVTGHHLEYLHHIYMGAISHLENKYVFVIPEEFEVRKGQYDWPAAANIKIEPKAEIASLNKGNTLAVAWRLSLFLRHLSQQHDADRIFLILMKQPMPLLPFLLPRKTKVSGILYDIFLYQKRRGQVLWHKALCYLWAHHPQVQKVFVLNDGHAAKVFNEKYSCDKFVELPDPIKSIDKDTLRDIRSDLGATETDCVFLHFGALDGRKGTRVCLKALEQLSEEELKGKVFVFAGTVSNSIKQEFYALTGKLREKARIVVYDEFCDDTFLNDLCFSSDYLLIPYLQSYRSSGVIGYASFFRKPVLGPKEGLIGKLIDSYKLGISADEITPQNVANGIVELAKNGYPTEDIAQYADCHTVEDFTRVVFGVI